MKDVRDKNRAGGEIDSRGSEPPLLSVNNFVTMDISLYFLFYPFLLDLINPSSSLTGGNI